MEWRKKREVAAVKRLIEIVDKAKLTYLQKTGFSDRRWRCSARQCHTSCHPLNTQKTREDLLSTVTEQPPYTPDLSPCHYHIFSLLKRNLDRFDNCCRNVGAQLAVNTPFFLIKEWKNYLSARKNALITIWRN